MRPKNITPSLINNSDSVEESELMEELSWLSVVEVEDIESKSAVSQYSLRIACCAITVTVKDGGKLAGSHTDLIGILCHIGIFGIKRKEKKNFCCRIDPKVFYLPCEHSLPLCQISPYLDLEFENSNIYFKDTIGSYLPETSTPVLKQHKISSYVPRTLLALLVLCL